MCIERIWIIFRHFICKQSCILMQLKIFTPMRYTNIYNGWEQLHMYIHTLQHQRCRWKSSEIPGST